MPAEARSTWLWLALAPFLSLFVAVLLLSTDRANGMGTWLRLGGELQKLRAAVCVRDREVASLERQVQSLRSGDPFEIERRAREDLHMIRPGEIRIPIE